MRQVFLEKGRIALKDVMQPSLDDDLILIEVHYSCISSGTEAATITNAQGSVLTTNIPQKIAKVLESLAQHGVQGTKSLIKGRLAGTVATLGYSCSGQVIATGKKIKTLRPGDFVACAGAGYAHHAQIVCVPEHLVTRISNPHYLKQASITTIGAIALQGIRRAGLQLGETVCVLGLGLLGQLTVQLAKLAGCRVIGLDIQPDRLALAQALGADVVLPATDPATIKQVEFLTHHYGVDCTIITAASQSHDIIQQAMVLTRKKGKVVLVGDVGLNIERAPFYQKEIDLLISCSYGPGRYDPVYEKQGIDYPYPYVRWTEHRNMEAIVSMIEQGHLKIDPIINTTYPLEKASEAYQAITQHKLLGCIIDYTQEHEDDKQSSLPPSLPHSAAPSQTFGAATQLPEGPYRVGIIGAGGFAKVKLMPVIAKIKNMRIQAIADPDIANSINTSRTYGAAHAITHEQELWQNDLADIIVIASPHKYHAEQAQQAIAHGKAVFLEKPMVTTFEQYEHFATFLQNNPQARLCVDYNRSFAPCIQAIKKLLHARKNPLMIQYRMNAGFIPKDHWVQTEVGAGRIIGEACHIIDLFCFMTDSKPQSISVESLRPSSDDLFPTDNFCVSITFYDGSVCHLLYTALGHSALGKERMEVYCDGQAIVMEDYKYVKTYGVAQPYHYTSLQPHKGHEELIKAFFAAVQEAPFIPPISFERLTTVAHTTLIIDQLACQGGGTQIL